MVYSEALKKRLVARMLGPEKASAKYLAEETGIGKSTLGRWRKQAVDADVGANRQGQDVQGSQKMAKNWSAQEKMRVVLHSQTLENEALGAFLRSEGVYEAQLIQWRDYMLAGLTDAPKNKRAQDDERRHFTQQIKELERELRRKEKALAEAAALLILKKKVQSLWGDEDDEPKQSNEH